MRSTLTAFVLCTPLLLAAPALKSKPTYYHAVNIGDTLVYEYKFGETTSEMVDVITAVESKTEGYVVTIARVTGDTKRVTGQMLVSEKGISRLASGEKTLATPMVMLKLPAKANEAWENPVDAQIQKYFLKTIGEELVEVPAGKFKAIRVEMKGRLPGVDRDVSYMYWYAPNLGVVKSITNTSGTDRIMSLKEFKPGAKK